MVEEEVEIEEPEYEEPIRARDLLADAIFGKDFDELTDLEKQKIHKLAMKLREIV